MKRGVFFDSLMDDPRNNGHADEAFVKRYLMNLAIVDSLREDYEVEVYDNIFEASSRIHNASPEQAVDFFIADIVAAECAHEWAKEMNTKIRSNMRGIDKLSVEQRSRIIESLIEEEERFLDRAYSGSLYCFGQLHKYHSQLTIIAYTLAPDYICQKCVHAGSIDQLLFRTSPNPEYAATRLRQLVEAGR